MKVSPRLRAGPLTVEEETDILEVLDADSNDASFHGRDASPPPILKTSDPSQPAKVTDGVPVENGARPMGGRDSVVMTLNNSNLQSLDDSGSFGSGSAGGSNSGSHGNRFSGTGSQTASQSGRSKATANSGATGRLVRRNSEVGMTPRLPLLRFWLHWARSGA